MRLRAPGFRGRLVMAMAATSVVTLAVAGAAVVSPLERRLRADAVHALTVGTQSARGSLDPLSSDELADPGTTAHIARSIGRRTGSHVVLLDGRLAPIADNDPDERLGNPAAASAALGRGRTVRDVRRVDGVTYAEVAVPMHLAGRHYVLAASRSLRELDSAVHVIRQGLIAGAIAGLAAALLLGLLLSARLVRRLRRLRDVALTVADDPSRARVPPDRGDDEVAELTRALATMRTRLERQESARRAFVATASHELRTPLASLAVRLELLDEDLRAAGADPAGAAVDVARAREQVERLAGLARDLLDLSRLDSEVALRSEPVELGELCRAVLAEFEEHARHRDVGLELDAPRDGCWAVADPGGVARIVRILVENALRFAPAGTPVSVEVTRDGDRARMQVGDRGPGVPADERDRVFDRFARGSDTGGEGGFGLGLAIARELAGRMDGSVVLAGDGPGARFAVTLWAAEERAHA
jgi:signal transduction histidine kinase